MFHTRRRLLACFGALGVWAVAAACGSGKNPSPLPPTASASDAQPTPASLASQTANSAPLTPSPAATLSPALIARREAARAALLPDVRTFLDTNPQELSPEHDLALLEFLALAGGNLAPTTGSARPTIRSDTSSGPLAASPQLTALNHRSYRFVQTASSELLVFVTSFDQPSPWLESIADVAARWVSPVSEFLRLAPPEHWLLVQVDAFKRTSQTSGANMWLTLGPNASPAVFSQLVAHEFTHSLQRSVQNMPTWFTEGSAEFVSWRLVTPGQPAPRSGIGATGYSLQADGKPMPVDTSLSTSDLTYFRYGGNGYLFLNQAGALLGDSSMRDVLGAVCGGTVQDAKIGQAVLARLRSAAPPERLADFDALVQRCFQTS